MSTRKPPKISASERDEFQQAMRNLKSPEKTHSATHTSIQVIDYQRDVDYLPNIGADDILSYRSEGLQHKLWQQLKTGRVKIDADCDLHGLNAKEAYACLYEFFSQAVQHNLRCIRIIHGRGLHNPDGKALLKALVADYLPNQPAVLAFHTAARSQGGTGAVLVYLKRSR